MLSAKDAQSVHQAQTPTLHNTQSCKTINKQQTLFLMIYEFPLLRDDIKSYSDLLAQIQKVSTQLSLLQKIDPQQIEKVCYSNHRLLVVSRILKDCAAMFPDNPKQINFGSAVILMFTTMMISNKMIDFLNKIMVPLSIYRLLIKIFYIKSNKAEASRRIYNQIIRKQETYQCLKFLGKWISVSSRTFPRSFANILERILVEFPKLDRNILQEKEGQEVLLANSNRQNQRIIQLYNYISIISCQLLRGNLKLSAQSGLLLILYRRAIQGQLSWMLTQQIISAIVTHMIKPQTRDIILTSIDLGKVFAFFTNVDCRKDYKIEQKIQKNAYIIEILISSWSTLIFFIHERVTLKNFIASLNSKSDKEISIINDKIFSKIIDRALKYDRQKMQRSQNDFGVQSNYLNLRALTILAYFLDSTNLFQFYQSRDPKGDILRNLGKISLMYFPITFEKDKYNKQIIHNIRLPSVKTSHPLSGNFLNWLSYTNECIVGYQFQRQQFINYLHDVCKFDDINNVPTEIVTSINHLLSKFKKANLEINNSLMFQYYKTMIELCEYLPWRPEYLRLSKFLSEIVQQLCINSDKKTLQLCVQITQRIFMAPKPDFYRYLYVTILNDIGKYFGDCDQIQQLIVKYYQDPQYSFRISRILLHMDFNKKQIVSSNLNQKQLLQKICCQNGCVELILQSMEIIKFYCMQNDDKGEWGVKLICQNILYHPSQEIVNNAVQFCEQVVVKHRYYQKFIQKVQLSQIVDTNLRKRVMYIMLRSETGIQSLEKYCPNFIKNQLDTWFKEDSQLIKQVSSFLTKQNKKYSTNKGCSFIDIGSQLENRYSLIYLPWNIKLNGKFFIALTSYKNLKQKIKLRISPMLKIENSITIGMFQMGAVQALKSDSQVPIVIKREEIMRNYQKNKYRDAKQVKKFAVSKDTITFILSYNNDSLILEKLIINIPLSKKIYRPLIYPLNFISLLTKTNKGLSLLRSYKSLENCLKLLHRDKDPQIIKGSIFILGVFFASHKLETLEKIQIYEAIQKFMDNCQNTQIKQFSFWSLVIIIKDDDFRKRVKQLKNWLLLESKYCGWMCYPQFYGNKYDSYDKVIKRFDYYNSLASQKTNDSGYSLIFSLLESNDRADNKNQKQKDKKRQVYQYFKKPDNRQLAWNSQLFSGILTHLSAINFDLDKIKQFLDIYSEYLNSQQFQKDFATGFTIP